MPGEPALEPAARRRPQLLASVGLASGLRRFGRAGIAPLPAGGKTRQDRRQRARPKGAALGDLDGRRERLGQIGEQCRHFRAGLEAVLRRQLAALAVGDQPAFGDAEQRVVRLVVVTRGEKRLVGRDKRQAARIGKLDQRRLGQPFRRHAVALQFDVKAITEQALQRFAARLRERALAAPIARSSGPPGPPVSAIRPSASAAEPGELDVRLLGRSACPDRRAS